MLGTGDTKGLYESWERAAGAWFDAWARSPAFLNVMGRMLAAQLGVKAGANRLVDDALEVWRIPSSRDLEALAERIAALEERLARVESGAPEPSAAAGGDAR